MARAVACLFCDRYFKDKHKYCNHVANKHNNMIPDEAEPLEYAYSLYVHKDVGRLCTQCRKNPVHFNRETLKYERLCDDPHCKEAYVTMMKTRMRNKYGKEHLLNDADMQRKMIYNHPQARDFVWDEKHKFRVIGSYEADFLNQLRSLDWSPDDVIAPSPNNYWYKWQDGSTHLYIPDFYIPSLSLEVEIKESDNTSGRMEHSREIEFLKDKRMRAETNATGINYIKIVDKNYDEFIESYVKSNTNRPE
jgi:hypothetical protein